MSDFNKKNSVFTVPTHFQNVVMHFKKIVTVDRKRFTFFSCCLLKLDFCPSGGKLVQSAISRCSDFFGLHLKIDIPRNVSIVRMWNIPKKITNMFDKMKVYLLLTNASHTTYLYFYSCITKNLTLFVVCNWFEFLQSNMF